MKCPQCKGSGIFYHEIDNVSYECSYCNGRKEFVKELQEDRIINRQMTEEKEEENNNDT